MIAFAAHWTPRPHLWRWRCHRPSRHDSFSPIVAPLPPQCPSVIPPQTWIGRLLPLHLQIWKENLNSAKTSPFLFLGISGLQLIICNNMFHLRKEYKWDPYVWGGLTLEKLTNSNLWVNLRRSHIRGFGWPLWVTVASTRNNLQMICSESLKPKKFL